MRRNPTLTTTARIILLIIRGINLIQTLPPNLFKLIKTTHIVVGQVVRVDSKETNEKQVDDEIEIEGESWNESPLEIEQPLSGLVLEDGLLARSSHQHERMAVDVLTRRVEFAEVERAVEVVVASIEHHFDGVPHLQLEHVAQLRVLATRLARVAVDLATKADVH